MVCKIATILTLFWLQKIRDNDSVLQEIRDNDSVLRPILTAPSPVTAPWVLQRHIELDLVTLRTVAL